MILVNFWTYSCINSLRELPYMKAWASKYKDAGLVVIGVHTPEFSFEKETANVEQAVTDLKVTYPIAIDSNYGIWQAFTNNYWPATYIVDGTGRIRYHYFGEGAYVEAERVIQDFCGKTVRPVSTEARSTYPPMAEAPQGGDVRSPETYVGLAALSVLHPLSDWLRTRERPTTRQRQPL